MKNHTKIIRIAFFSFLFLTLFSCQEKPDKTIISDKIAEQLKSGDNVDTFFIGLKFGMSKDEYDNHILNMVNNNRVKELTSTTYITHTYEYPNNDYLKNINWFLRPEFHNDTLIGMEVSQAEGLWNLEGNSNSAEIIYRLLTSEIKKKYGEPSYSVNKSIKYWFVKNLEIEIKKIEDSGSLGERIWFSFINTRKRNQISLSKCRIDNLGNSMDLWYYKQKKEKHIQDSIQRVKENEIKIAQAKHDSIEESKVFAYNIKKLSKSKRFNKTNIDYMSYTLLYREIQEKAKRQMWKKGREDKEIELLKKYKSGGVIEIKIERLTRGAADFENWTVIIKDLKDNELYRRGYSKKNPYRCSDDMWCNFETVWLNKRFKTPFYVYLVDEIFDKTHKFKVVPIKK